MSIVIFLMIGIVFGIEYNYYLKVKNENRRSEERLDSLIQMFYNIDDSVISEGEMFDVRFGSLANYDYKLNTQVYVVNKKEAEINKVIVFIPYLEDEIILEKGNDIFEEGHNRFGYFSLADFVEYDELDKYQTEISKNLNLEGTRISITYDDYKQEEHILHYNLKAELESTKINDLKKFLKTNNSDELISDLLDYFTQLYFYDINLYKEKVLEFRELLKNEKLKEDDISPIINIYYVLRYDKYLDNDFNQMVVKDLKEAYYEKSNLGQGFRYHICILLESINKKLNFYDQTKLMDEVKKFWNGGYINIDKILKEIE